MADERRQPEQRPSPEALLAEARREEKGRVGRLKIFVGAAPGVGKTYEMLQTARAKLKEGVDVIVGVDQTPDDLIQRLKEGKVYVPKQAERALKHYFSPVNLTALRELALRRTAERVDEQLLEHMQARAIPGPWAAGERILVCVSEDPRAAGLVRYTKRLADRLHAPFTAVSIETRRSLQLSDAERDRLADTLRLAESLGGEALTIPA